MRSGPCLSYSGRGECTILGFFRSLGQRGEGNSCCCCLVLRLWLVQQQQQQQQQHLSVAVACTQHMEMGIAALVLCLG